MTDKLTIKKLLEQKKTKANKTKALPMDQFDPNRRLLMGNKATNVALAGGLKRGELVTCVGLSPRFLGRSMFHERLMGRHWFMETTKEEVERQMANVLRPVQPVQARNVGKSVPLPNLRDIGILNSPIEEKIVPRDSRRSVISTFTEPNFDTVLVPQTTMDKINSGEKELVGEVIVSSKKTRDVLRLADMISKTMVVTEEEIIIDSDALEEIYKSELDDRKE